MGHSYLPPARPDLSVAGFAAEREPADVVVRLRTGDRRSGVKEQYGFLAEDMEKVLPQLVDLDKQGRPNSIDYVGLIPFMVNAIKELKEANDNLSHEVNQLKTRTR